MINLHVFHYVEDFTWHTQEAEFAIKARSNDLCIYKLGGCARLSFYKCRNNTSIKISPQISELSGHEKDMEKL